MDQKIQYKNQRIAKKTGKSDDLTIINKLDFQPNTPKSISPQKIFPKLSNNPSDKSLSTSNIFKISSKSAQIDLLKKEQFALAVEKFKKNEKNSKYFDSDQSKQSKTSQDFWKETEKNKYNPLLEKSQLASLIINLDNIEKTINIPKKEIIKLSPNNNIDKNLQTKQKEQINNSYNISKIEKIIDEASNKIMKNSDLSFEEQFNKMQEVLKSCMEEKLLLNPDEIIYKIWYLQQDLLKGYLASINLKLNQAKDKLTRNSISNSEINKAKLIFESEKLELKNNYERKEKKLLSEFATLEKQSKNLEINIENYLAEISKLKKSQEEQNKIGKIEKTLLESLNRYVSFFFQNDHQSENPENNDDITVNTLNQKFRKVIEKARNPIQTTNISTQTFPMNFYINSAIQCNIQKITETKNQEIQTNEPELILLKKTSSGESNDYIELKPISILSEDFGYNLKIETIPEVQESLELSIGKSKNHFFSIGSSESWEKNKNNIFSLTIDGLCDNYNSEINDFFKKIGFLNQEIEFEKFKKIHNEFIKNLFIRDSLRQKDLLEIKIEIYDKRIENEEYKEKIKQLEEFMNKIKEKIDHKNSFNNEKKEMNISHKSFRITKKKNENFKRTLSTKSLGQSLDLDENKKINYFTKNNNENYDDIKSIYKDDILKIKKFIPKNNGGSISIFYSKLNDKLLKNNLKNENSITITLSSLLKIMSNLIIETLKTDKSISFFYLLYDYLNKNYGGLKKSTENKILRILQSIILFSEKPKIKIFAILLGFDFKLNSFNNLDSQSELEILISQIKAFDDHNNEISLIASNTEEKVFVLYSKCIENITKYLSYRFVNNEKIIEKINSFIKKLKSFRILENGFYFVDFFLYFEELIYVRDEIREENIRPIFELFDFEKKKNYLSFDEFYLLFKYFDKKKKNKKYIFNLFKKESNFIENNSGNQFLNFQKFCFICENHSMNNISIVNNKNLDDKFFEILKRDWKLKTNFLKLKFIKCYSYSQFYKKIIDNIEIDINKNEGIEDNKSRIIIKYKIIDEEANFSILENEMLFCLPKELILISKLEEKLF